MKFSFVAEKVAIFHQSRANNQHDRNSAVAAGHILAIVRIFSMSNMHRNTVPHTSTQTLTHYKNNNKPQRKILLRFLLTDWLYLIGEEEEGKQIANKRAISKYILYLHRYSGI